MTDVPKIVYDRLRAGKPEEAHPEPDVLTAFAEQTLSATEREDVLQHLALCGECREVVALSIPPVAAVAEPGMAGENGVTASGARGWAGKAGSGRRNWFAWPGLRWAALAAGVAVAAGVLIVYSGKPNEVREAKQPSESAIAQPNDSSLAKRTAAPVAKSEFAASADKKLEPAAPALRRDQERKVTLSKATPAKAAPAKAVPTEEPIAVGRLERPAMNKDVAAGAMAASPAPPRQFANAVSETVEVSGAAAAVTTKSAEKKDSMVALNEAAPMISKAKAARATAEEASAPQKSAELETKQGANETAPERKPAAIALDAAASQQRAYANNTNFPQPQQYPALWAIRGRELQRSLNSGAAWKTVLRSERPLLCYGSGGNDVWAGGKGGALFHSANGGITWNEVHPSIQAQALTADVTHVDVYGPAKVILFTSNKESWSTADGGKTWEKR